MESTGEVEVPKTSVEEQNNEKIESMEVEVSKAFVEEQNNEKMESKTADSMNGAAIEGIGREGNDVEETGEMLASEQISEAPSEPVKASDTKKRSTSMSTSTVGKPRKRRSRGFRSGKEKKKKKSNGGVASVEGNYWEIELIEGFRKNNTKKNILGGPVIEFLVKWVGFEERTWEPEENLCDSALEHARKVMSQHSAKQLGLNDDNDTNEALVDEEIGKNEIEMNVETDPTNAPAGEEDSMETVSVIDGLSGDATENETFEDKNWDWADQGQVNLREIERISVKDPFARIKVAGCIENGTPVVLIDHVGWAQFAKPWLVEVSEHENGIVSKTSETITEIETPPNTTASSSIMHENGNVTIEETHDSLNTTAINKHDHDIPDNSIPNLGTSPTPSNVQPELLDLSKPHYVDTEKLLADIGSETVPVIRKKYNEQNPIHAEVTVETFIRKCWPTLEELEGKVPKRKLQLLYLHQWQFPLSETAVNKLCGEGKNISLPNHILGDDLLRYWIEKEKTNGDNPYQYLFMGHEGTKSNLHKDNGNLMITIAPIVGTKEVTLVHRADGQNCLYYLEANIDQPDLHRFPLMYSVRAWKSVIKPGEILLMPQGTYHQCRNLTPCLSYHRFYLDTSNLKAFLESYLDQDAVDMNHDEVIWNASYQLHEKLQSFSEEVAKTGDSSVPYEIVDAVDSIRVLRNIARELAIRNRTAIDESKSTMGTKTLNEWDDMVHDIDMTLNLFRYRLRKRIPPFRRRRQDSDFYSKLKVGAQLATKVKPEVVQSIGIPDGFQAPDVEEEEQPARTILEGAIRKLPKLEKAEFGASAPDSVKFKVGDRVNIRQHGKRISGIIENIKETLDAAYLSYELFPSCHDEYQPIDRLRVRAAGGETTEVSGDALYPGMHLFYIEPSGDEVRGVVKALRKATFYLIVLELDFTSDFVHKQWVTRDIILSIAEKKSGPTTPRKKISKIAESTPKSLQLATLVVNDTSVSILAKTAKSEEVIVSTAEVDTTLVHVDPSSSAHRDDTESDAIAKPIDAETKDNTTPVSKSHGDTDSLMLESCDV